MNKNFETIAIRTQMQKTNQKEHSTPLYLTSSFRFDDSQEAIDLFQDKKEGNIYSRYSNPNNDEFIQKMCLLEGTEVGMAMATGMAAMFTSLASFLQNGDHIVASRSIFGSTHQILTKILAKWGITHTYVEGTKIEQWEKAITSKTKMFFLESPTNPTLDIIDIKKVCDIAKSKNIIVNVDNCFATPYLQTPYKLGADIVTHSATKFIDGQGRVLGGAILTSKKLFDEIKFMTRHTGPSLAPFNGWILSKSLETLAVRMDRHCSNALALAQYLEKSPFIKKVNYPFLKSSPFYDIAQKQMKQGGGLVGFEINGNIKEIQKFMNSLKMISLSSNLGDTRSIATHPTSTTHNKLSEEERLACGITPNFVRISVGLEHIDDILSDVENALQQSKN